MVFLYKRLASTVVVLLVTFVLHDILRYVSHLLFLVAGQLVQHFLAGIAGDALEGFVDAHDIAGRVGDQD